MKNLKLILSFVIVAFFAFQTKATIYTIGNDTLYFFNDNYYFIGNNDTVLIDTTIIAVEFIENTSLSGISSFELNYGLSFHLELCSGGNQYTTPSGQSFINLCNSIDSDSRVEKLITYCFLELHEFEPDDDNIDDQWYLKNIGVYDDATLSGVWDITLGCSDVVIAVLDAGTDWDKEEFGPKYSSIDAIYKNPGEDEWSPWNHPNSGNGIDDDGNGYIDDLKGWDFDHVEMQSDCDNIFSSDNDPSSNSYWHGNAVAGIIAAKTNNGDGIAGIAGGNTENNKAGIKILPIKVNDKYKYWFYTDCYTAEHMSAANVAAAICYATDLGADVINMSFGIPQNPHTDFDSQIKYAYDAGVTLVGSAGNGGFYGRVAYPAKLNQIIAVGATDEDDNRWTESSHGQYLEISAPGEDVTVLTSGDGSVTEASGTSFSAPMVSATVGLMLSVNPSLTNGGLDEDGSIRNILKRTADKTGTWGYDENGWNEWLGYGRLNTYEAVCMAIDYKPEIVVQDDDIWTERVISKENIVLEAGKNLTITGEVMMGKDAKIIVKQGATLTVDGGTITNMPFCGKEDEMWRGIEVWGNPNDDQFEYAGHPLAQGKLILKDATIEHATVAVRNFDYSNQTTTAGGIIIANNSTFKNNGRAISLRPYKNITSFNDVEYDYRAAFTNCTFTVDSDYLGGASYPAWHMMIWGVKGIRINGCIFENKLDNISSGNAIFSEDAGFVIKGACEVNEVSPCPTGEYQNTTFDGFYRAIESVNSSNALYSIAIRESEFSNNGYGIHFSSVNDAVVVDNEFSLGMYDDCDYDAGTGIFLDNCKRFAIENNEFSLPNPVPPLHYVGIHTVNTNNAFDEIYDNKFDDMIVANHAEGKNWNVENTMGLAYYCNKNQNNSWDFYVEKDDGSGKTGIQKDQGSRYYVAGNTFSQSATGHFNNWGSYEIDYYYDQATSAEVPSKLYRVEPYPELLGNTCPNHYEGGDILLSTSAYQQRESDYNSALSSYNTAYNLYNSTNDSATKRMYEEQMSYYNMLLSRAVYDIVRSDLADTLVQDDKFITWQEELNTYAAAESVVDLYLQQGDFVAAMNKVDSLQIDFVFDAYDSVEYPYYQNLKSLQATWMDQGRTIFELTAAEINSLSAIADSSRGVAGAQARGILAFAYDSIYSYSSCAQMPDTTKKSAIFSGDFNNEKSGLFVTAKPNPANNSVTFTFTLPDNVESTLLSLYNANGGLVDKLVLNKSMVTIKYNCSHLKSGIYYYSVSCLNEQKTGKIIIVR